MNYLDGYVYHMAHFDTLKGIFLRQAILSKNKVSQELLSYQSIANDEVQRLRDRVFVKDPITGVFKSLHSYVPFYFATHTPMHYVQFRNNLQGKLVLLEISRNILKEKGVLFTDGNATNQQLSEIGTERVGIIPIRSEIEVCQRLYRPSGPHGSNSNCSNFYADVKLLERLDWNNINERWWGNDSEKIRIKHAEILVPDIVPISEILHIYVSNNALMWDVNAQIVKCKLKGHVPFATCKPELFF